MNIYYLPPSSSGRFVQVIDPPALDRWDVTDPSVVCVPNVRSLLLRESIYEGKFVLAAYDRPSDTLYIRDLSPVEMTNR